MPTHGPRHSEPLRVLGHVVPDALRDLHVGHGRLRPRHAVVAVELLVVHVPNAFRPRHVGDRRAHRELTHARELARAGMNQQHGVRRAQRGELADVPHERVPSRLVPIAHAHVPHGLPPLLDHLVPELERPAHQRLEQRPHLRSQHRLGELGDLGTLGAVEVEPRAAHGHAQHGQRVPHHGIEPNPVVVPDRDAVQPRSHDRNAALPIPTPAVDLRNVPGVAGARHRPQVGLANTRPEQLRDPLRHPPHRPTPLRSIQ